MIYIQLYEYMRGNDNHEMKYVGELTKERKFSKLIVLYI